MRLYNNGIEAEHGDVLKITRRTDLVLIDIFFQSGVYSHWGIYCKEPDGGYVIHYSAPEGKGDFKGVVLKTPLEKFLDGANKCEVMTDKYPNGFSGKETVARAEKKIGRSNYNLWLNNCEHFAVWCKTGKHESSQTEILKPLEKLGYAVAETLDKIL